MRSHWRVRPAVAVVAICGAAAGLVSCRPPASPRDPAFVAAGWPVFPWPPPIPSASYNVPPESIPQRLATLGDVAGTLGRALEAAGYYESSFLAIPEGFALVTRAERINQDGTARHGDERWGGSSWAGFRAILSGFLWGNPNHHRIFVFAVTLHAFSPDTPRITAEAAHAWFDAGLNRLPDDVATRSFSPAYKITALIYEFEQIVLDGNAELKKPSFLLGRMHLERSGILGILFGR